MSDILVGHVTENVNKLKFDYLRTGKQCETTNNNGINRIFAVLKSKLTVLVFAGSKFLRNMSPANSNEKLYNDYLRAVLGVSALN